MKAEFDNATIKVWFTTKGVSRNFENVTKIVMSESSYLIQTANGNQYILSLPNVNMLEEIETEDIDKKLLELQEKYGRKNED